jgi:hypothetical protein
MCDVLSVVRRQKAKSASIAMIEGIQRADRNVYVGILVDYDGMHCRFAAVQKGAGV